MALGVTEFCMRTSEGVGQIIFWHQSFFKAFYFFPSTTFVLSLDCFGWLYLANGRRSVSWEKKAGKNSAVCWGRADHAAQRLTTFFSAHALWEASEACSHTEITAHHVCSRNTPSVWIAPLATEDGHLYGLCTPLSGTAPRIEDMAHVHRAVFRACQVLKGTRKALCRLLVPACWIFQPSVYLWQRSPRVAK